MTRKLSYGISENNISVNFDGQSHIIPRTDALADKLLAALREGRQDEIPDLISAAKRIEKYGQGHFVVRDGQIIVNGQAVHEVLSKKILQFQAEGLPYKPLVKFAENLQSNPSYRAVSELYTFLEKNDHPITEEGNFIAYKRVRENFKDIHSGTMDNSVGTVVEMPRNQVNDDCTQTCSYGLHVANWEYAHTQFASHSPTTDVMLEVEVNPADVVSIPVDYNNAKMRVCKYKVLGVVDSEHSSDIHLRVVNPDYLNSDSEEADCCDCCDDCACDEVNVDVCLTDTCSCGEDEAMFATCEICGEETDLGYNLCLDCEMEEDAYPWEDELK